MADHSTQLLRFLGRGVRPFDSTDTPIVNATGIDFSEMLDRARAGDPESGFKVKLTADLDRELTIEQRRALGIAVDRVVVVGSEHALILLDERILLVDVRTRTVLEQISHSNHEPVGGIDAFIRAPQDEVAFERAVDPDAKGVRGLARGVRNASLVQSLPENASI